jgi:transposase-like protein
MGLPGLLAGKGYGGYNRLTDGLKLMISDAHEGIKSAVSKIFTATWQRCRVPFMRNALAHAGKSGRRVVSAFLILTPRAASRRVRAEPFCGSRRCVTRA